MIGSISSKKTLLCIMRCCWNFCSFQPRQKCPTKAAGVSALPWVANIHTVDSECAQVFWLNCIYWSWSSGVVVLCTDMWNMGFLSAISAHSCGAELIHLTDKYIKGSMSKAINISCGAGVYALQEVLCWALGPFDAVIIILMKALVDLIAF